MSFLAQNRSTRGRKLLIAMGGLLLVSAAPVLRPRAAIEELVAADHALSRRAQASAASGGLFAAFDDTVIAPMAKLDLPTPRSALVARLEQEDKGIERMVWSLVRSGISADGTHGYTLGHVTARAPDGATRAYKYLAYWVKRPVGWRIAAFKRVPRPEGTVRVRSLETDWPGRPLQLSEMTPSMTDAPSLDSAERAFASEAQRIGLRAAFTKHGSATAVNMGQGADFTVGAAKIGAEMGDDPQSPVDWAPDGTLVAPSGDLGVSWGRLRSNDPAQAGRTSPFFTVWRRANRNAPWFYVAE